MCPDVDAYPVAVSQLGEADSREAQTARAIKWLLARPGGPIVVVTPLRDFESDTLQALIAHPPPPT